MSLQKGKFRCLVAGALALTTQLASAELITYTTSLSGAAEAPANASPGLGSATLLIDTISHLMTIDVTFSGLLGTTTASHIHCCTAAAGVGTAGVATQVPNFVGFPLGVTSGIFNNTLDLSAVTSWNPAFITSHGGTTASAEAALLAGLEGDSAYLNIHTTSFPGGEIRGFLVREVPEPGVLGLLGLGAGIFALGRRRALPG